LEVTELLLMTLDENGTFFGPIELLFELLVCAWRTNLLVDDKQRLVSAWDAILPQVGKYANARLYV
jgi:hypothetical protein